LLEYDNSDDRIEHLKIRKTKGAEAGFKIYQKNELKLDNQPVRIMSNYTQKIVQHIDYEEVINKRKTNFEYLENALRNLNDFVVPKLDSFVCPMVYPFRIRHKDLRIKLISNKIFIARYWPNVQPYLDYNLEVQLANEIMPLPIDQRYCKDDMDNILNIIFNEE
jgi:hypothetical protein